MDSRHASVRHLKTVIKLIQEIVLPARLVNTSGESLTSFRHTDPIVAVADLVMQMTMCRSTCTCLYACNLNIENNFQGMGELPRLEFAYFKVTATSGPKLPRYERRINHVPHP